MHILATSRPFLLIPIDGPVANLADYTPEIALIPDDGTEPADGDWHTATWIRGKAALLIGPGGGIEYPAGRYMAFAAITAGQERPVMPSGRVQIGGLDEP